MDDTWERSIPFYELDEATAAKLLRHFDAKIKLDSIHPMKEGKRNTNYRIHTSIRDYVLRIYPPGDNSWRKEAGLRRLLEGKVPLQRLYHMDQNEMIGNRMFAVFEYVNGQTLLEAMRSGIHVPEEMLRQLGSLLASIHDISFSRVGFFNERLEVVEELPALETWYDYFLTPLVGKRLGDANVSLIKRLVIKNKSMLRDMDDQVSLVHGDCRPTNLLVFNGRINCVLDWEFAMAGHSIADVGQLFRYEDQFSAAHKTAFAQAYNECSKWKLPENWESMGKMRDLINLLQMLGADEELPVKFHDLRMLINNTLKSLSESTAI